MEKQQFLDLKGLGEVLDYIKKYYGNDQEVIVPRASYTLFPSVGNSNAIYIDTSTDLIYRWDDNNVKYYTLSFDPTATYVMQCGNSKG